MSFNPSVWRFPRHVQFHWPLGNPVRFIQSPRTTERICRLAAQWCLTLHLVQISRSLSVWWRSHYDISSQSWPLAPRPPATAQKSENARSERDVRLHREVRCRQCQASASWLSAVTRLYITLWGLPVWSDALYTRCTESTIKSLLSHNYKDFIRLWKLITWMEKERKCTQGPFSPHTHANMCQTWCRGHGFSCENTRSNWCMHHTIRHTKALIIINGGF